MTTTTTTPVPTARRAWLVMVLAPSWFAVASLAVGTYFVATGTDPGLLESTMSAQVPVVLLIAELLMAATLLAVVPSGCVRSALASTRETTTKGWALGAGVGLVIATAYFSAISPLQAWLQRVVGDYVPPGETTATLTTHVLAFFVANVLLAPIVEELTYREVGLRGLQNRHSTVVAAAITTIMFGLLHWLGGGWYVAITAIFAGVPLVCLRLQWGLGAALAAHLALNLAEFCVLIASR